MALNNTYNDQNIKDIINAAQNLEENIQGLHNQLLATLSNMDDLRHKGTAMQRSLLQTKKQNEETSKVIKELGRIMRGFQEQGRLFETVAEPLSLVNADIAAKLGKSASDLNKIANQNE
ncbi:hypothetical protein M1N17_03230 [Dehalococcoidia bacterium]|nr:hypothetical protein [Dehalococcoidia bacterium]